MISNFEIILSHLESVHLLFIHSLQNNSLNYTSLPDSFLKLGINLKSCRNFSKSRTLAQDKKILTGQVKDASFQFY